MAELREASPLKVQVEQEFTRIYGVPAQHHRPLLESQQEFIALLCRIITDVMRRKAGRLHNRAQSRCKVSTRISCVTDSLQEGSLHKRVEA